MEKIDKFYGEYRYLSNFYMADVEFEGVIYASSEHAYQAAKTLIVEEREKVAKAKTAGESRKEGRNVTIRDGWDEMRASVMFKIVYNKFQRHPDLSKKLMETFPLELIEGNNWGDHYFGVCEGYGKNVLGHVLMAVRGLLILQKITGNLPPINFDKDFLRI